MHLRLKYKEVLFPDGVSNIKVTGTYGWTTCPAAIKQAVVMLCRNRNDPTLYTVYGGFSSEKLGDYSYTINKKKLVSGIEEVDKLLEGYIRKKPMMGVA